MNIGTGRQVSVNRLAAMMGERAGTSISPVHAPERAGELRHSALDPQRAAIHLGWEPWTDLAEGLGNVLDHISARH